MSSENVVQLRPVDQARVIDSLVNFAAGMGVGGKDKRLDSVFVSSYRLGWEEMEALYREDWIAGKIVEIIPDEMTKNWRIFDDGGLTPEQRTAVQEEEKRLKLRAKVNLNMRWARMYGGSLLVLNVDDGLDPSEPLVIENIKPGQLKSINIFDRRHASAQRINLLDPQAENFRQPETYRLANTSSEIHHTRVVRMDGTPLPFHLQIRNEYWGDSIFVRIRNALVNAGIATDSSAGLLFESNVDVVSVEGLLHMLSSDEGTKQLIHRFSTSKFLKANNNISVIDKGKEEIQKLSNAFSGIPDLLDRFLTILSASADIPATRLFGKAPVGMNATGESDLRNFYDHVASRQELDLRPKLEYIDMVIAANLGIPPEDMQFSFNPLWKLPDNEAADIKLKNAQADQIYFDLGVITESMLAADLKNRNTYSTITDEWIKELEAAEEEAKKLAAEGNDPFSNEPDEDDPVEIEPEEPEAIEDPLAEEDEAA